MDHDLLAHLPLRKRRELDRVLKILFEEFDEAQKGRLSAKNKGGQILKVLLFGSYARGNWVEDHASGYYSDYDILIVVNTETFADEDEFWRTAHDRIIREEQVTKRLKTPVNFIVHSLHDVNDKLAQGLPFFVDVISDGIPLYEVRGYGFAEPKPITAEERQARAQAYFDDWFPSAVYNVTLAGYASKDMQLKQAAFNLHQATERFYHCVMLVFTLYSPPLHSLRKLRPLAESYDARLRDVWSPKNRLARRCFDRLHRAYVEARYSTQYKVTSEELDWLFDAVTRLQTAVEMVCRERLAAAE
ncbi:nucleotidyltransferase domain-containing protein [Agrobacterium vitis]|uniref:nucleotidyltransferase domain-containing protein n=1 Tax=Agrobacterium vitis TaxID=373 RepID=UPI0012E8D351|nr:nucleotidyltransferase domain-containing protein [Agrobacterium vitis]MVA23751.1 HEPN domain-containing protein [Agrobacterium vitis]